MTRTSTAISARPRFMTPGMWFAWLLRSDVRQGAAPGDKEAQREFVAWWFLWGRNEYPEVWHWGTVQAAIAMQLVPVGLLLHRARLLRRLHSARPDLQHAFVLQEEESLAEFLSWYRVYGTLELDAAPQLPAACVAMTESPSQRQPWSADGVQ